MQNSEHKIKNFRRGFAAAKFLIIIVVGITVGISAYFGYRYVKNNLKITRGPEANLEKPEWMKTAKEAKEEMATIIPAPNPDFITDGHLQVRDEGEETENWVFLYEEPGRPAAVAYLTFNFRSKCDFGKGEQICNTKKFENGMYVHLEGIKSGSDVKVIKLKVLQ